MIRGFLLSLFAPLNGVLQEGLRLLLGRNQTGARLRFALVTAASLLYWFAVTALAGFPRILPPEWLATLVFPIDVLAEFLAAFFAPAVLLHVVPVAGGLWLGMRLGAHYLADLFELDNLRIAGQHLQAAVFGVDVPSLTIASGDLAALDHANPVVRIGGPGHLNVHLGLAAVFEAADGRPRVYGPGKHFLQGFERLRDIIDLRDQLRRLPEVRAVTRDGIEIFAHDVAMIFRVHGGGQPRTLTNPYPFDERAVRRLIYRQAVSREGPRRWTGMLPGLVAGRIRQFVQSHRLDELLALQPPAEALQEGAQARTFHISRRVLTDRFHTQETRQRLQQMGLELGWVGVGTWELRDTSPASGSTTNVGRTLISTWRNWQKAQHLRSESHLRRVRHRRQREVAGRFLLDLVDRWGRGGPRALDCLDMVRRLHRYLRDTRSHLVGNPDGRLPEPYQKVLDHLDRLSRPLELDGEGL